MSSLPGRGRDVGRSGEREPEREADLHELGRFVAASPPVRSLAVSGLFVLAFFYTLYFARAVFLPIVLAGMLNFLFSPVVRGLGRIGMPRALGSALVLLAFVGSVGYGVFRLAEPAAAWIESAPTHVGRIELRLRDIKEPVEQVTRATQEVEKIADVGGNGGGRTVQVERASLSGTLFSETRELLASAVVLLVLLYFLLASGDLFLRKLVRVLPRLEDKKRAVEIARQTDRDISTYIYTVTLVNFGVGAALAAALHLQGVPNPLLWGVVAFALNFIPYLGALVTIGILAVVGLAQFDGLGRALLVPGSFFLINLLEANLVTPLILGRRLTLNPVVIFVGLIFWSFMWGVPGAILAVPILATFKIVCDHVDPLRPVGEFLGR